MTTIPPTQDREIADRLRTWIRSHSRPACRMLSLGESCQCPLCDVDRLLTAQEPDADPGITHQVAKWLTVLGPWLITHQAEIELAIFQNVPLDSVLKSTHTLSNEGT